MLKPTVQIDLPRVRENATAIRRRAGVPVIAVIKANAYGLGAREVVSAIGDVVDGFYCFSLREAIEAETSRTGKPTIALLGDDDAMSETYRRHNVRPAVWDVERARRLRDARPVVCVDTGMQRFSCPPDQIDTVIEAGCCDEAYTHATKIEHVRRLIELCGNRGMKLHAAASSLIDEPEARLDAVRPGLALYRNAVRATTKLLDVRRSTSPAGYSDFKSSTGYHGVIAGGYSHGLRRGVCSVEGYRRSILECGMQTSYVEIDSSARVGGEVVLLGDKMPLADVAKEWNVSPQEVLLQLASSRSHFEKT